MNLLVDCHGHEIDCQNSLILREFLVNGATRRVNDALNLARVWHQCGTVEYVSTANAASKTISRVIGTGNRTFIDNPVAATVATSGGPTDLDADAVSWV